MKKLTTSLLAAALCLSSCAYVQTHKNIAEAFHDNEGYRVVEPLQLYSVGGTWYIAVQPETLRLHYPVLHDTIFLDTDPNPTYRTVKVKDGLQYHRISSQTAHVLLRSDGYYTLESLMEEVDAMKQEPITSLPRGASKHAILAQVQANTGKSVAKTTKRTPESTPVVGKMLSGLDFIVIDLPVSVVYNVAIPVMAPFVFFHRFISGEDDNK